VERSLPLGGIGPGQSTIKAALRCPTHAATSSIRAGPDVYGVSRARQRC
jgi:hypothetical protein